MKLRHFLKSISPLLKFKRFMFSLFHFSFLNVLKTFKAFVPNSAGNYRIKAKQTVISVNNFPLAMIDFLERHVSRSTLPQSVCDFVQSLSHDSPSGVLGEFFSYFGSDKSTNHNYDLVYEKILGDPTRVSGILEIGLGTNNTKIISNMGSAGKPGASLRAFRSYCPNARIFGADIDQDILFSEEKIQTFFVDQLDSNTFNYLARQLPSSLDLIIDDGLHSIDANMRTMTFALPLLKVGGWLVIEDIGDNSLELWRLIAGLLPSDYSSTLVLAKNGSLFVVQRL
jgi:hypothetical protein